MGPLAIPLIAAGTAIAQGIGNWAQARANANKTNTANYAMTRQQYQYDLDMWHKQNAYNDPSAQMQRLKAAGLNPNMVYGTGAVGNTSAPPPKYNAPTFDYRNIPAPISNAPEILSQYQNTRLQNAQLDLLKSQTANVNSRTLTETQQLFLNDMKKRLGDQSYEFRKVDNEIQQQRLQQMRALAPYQLSIISSQADQGENKVLMQFQQLRNMKKDEVIKALEIQAREKRMTTIDLQNEKAIQDIIFKKYENEFRKEGVTSSDHYLIRALSRSLNWSDVNKLREESNDKVWDKYSTPEEKPYKHPQYDPNNYPRKPK